MIRSLIYSITFHSVLVLLTILSLPFMLREPIDLPPIVSVELIQITDKTSIPYAPKARKIIEEKKNKPKWPSRPSNLKPALPLQPRKTFKATACLFPC